MKLVLPTIIITTAILAGCKHVYSEDGQCISCWNNPVTGEPINHDGEGTQTGTVDSGSEAQTQTQRESKYCHTRYEYEKTIPVGVDLAYVKYKRSFGFKTWDEKMRAKGQDPNSCRSTSSVNCMTDSGFRYEAQSGVRYQMQDRVDLQTDTRLGWLKLELDKVAENKTIAFVSYCVGGIEGFTPEYKNVIDTKMNAFD